MTMLETNPIVRFERWYIPEPNSGCWIWLGSLSGSKSYGYFCFNKRRHRAHRFSYELYRGPIPPDLVIDHLCRMPWCVNPDHLEVVTQKVNMERAAHTGRRNLFCPKGHPKFGDNLYVFPNGTHTCRECVRISVRKYQQRKREEKLQ